MLACQVAHSLFRVPIKLARVREQDYIKHANLFGRDDLPIDRMISPEGEAAKVVMGRLNVSSAQDALEFFNGKIELVEFTVRPKSNLAGLSLRELPEVMEDLNVYVVAHEHNDRWHVPKGDTVLLAGDHIYVAVEKCYLNVLMQTIGLSYQTPRGRNIMMVGGGRIGYLVAQELEKAGAKLKIIEHNQERAEWLSENLNDTVVLHGDALDQKLLEEENIDRMDDFLALTNDDENNILGSLIAKRYGVKHVVTLINRSIYTQLVRQLGLDTIVSPRQSTVATILGHLRKGRIHGMASLAQGKLEVLEAEALETSSILNTPLKDMKLPEDMVIGAILRDNEIIIPNGNTTVQPHDHVLIITTSELIPKMEKLFEVHLDFF